MSTHDHSMASYTPVAENAMSNGVATPGQAALVHADRLERAREHHRRTAQP